MEERTRRTETRTNRASRPRLTPAKEGGILITGSEGLVGAPLAAKLRASGDEVRRLDLRGARGESLGDVRLRANVDRAALGCRGIVHLAAVSRVVWAERDPGLCRATNVEGTRQVLAAALASPCRPWVLFASSREVYGQPARLPVDEDAPIAPVNVYGHAKAVGERLVDEARAVGLRTAVVRLSNVYGSPIDHQDRVVPAFCLAAARGRPIRIDGRDHLFDFTHVADVVAGLMGLIRLLDDGGSPPPIHLLTGRPTSLGRLAAECVDIAGVDLPVIEAPPRDYDVARFHGIPTRARELLGWAARVPLRQGLEGLIRAFRLPVSASVGEGRTS